MIPDNVQLVRPWWPVRLYCFDGKWWQPTGEWSWFRLVYRTRTFWDETYYTSVENFLSSKPWSKP